MRASLSDPIVILQVHIVINNGHASLYLVEDPGSLVGESWGARQGWGDGESIGGSCLMYHLKHTQHNMESGEGFTVAVGSTSW